MSAVRDYTTAIPVGSVAEQYSVIRSTPCPCGGFFVGQGQALLTDERTHKRYDLISARCIKCQTSREFLFDINSFFGRPTQAQSPPQTEPPSRGFQYFVLAVCAVLGLVAALVAFGPARQFAEPYEISAAYFVLALSVTGGVLVYRKLKAAPDSSKTAGAPADVNRAEPSGGRDYAASEALLGQLGLKLDWITTDPKTALLGGLIKAGLLRGCATLAAGQLDEAIGAFTSVINSPAPTGRADLVKSKALAHYLRGQAYEQQRRLEQARPDYNAALALWPNHPQIGAAVKRLKL